MLTDIFCSMTDLCFHYIMHLKVPLQQQYTKMSIIHVYSKLVDRWSHKNIVLPFSLHKKYIFLSVIVVVWTKNMLTPIRRPFRKKYINNFIWFCSISMPYDRMKVAFYCPLLFRIGKHQWRILRVWFRVVCWDWYLGIFFLFFFFDVFLFHLSITW